MKNLAKVTTMIIACIIIAGCHYTPHSDRFILSLDFSTDYDSYDGPYNDSWASVTETVLQHQGLHYSMSDILDYQFVYLSPETPTIDDISWILWDLGWIDSYVTGTLSESEIAYQIRNGKPIILQYGSYYNAQYMVIYGYDSRGHVYLQEPGYGTRVVHYDDLYHHHFHGVGKYWESSLILED